MYTKLILTILFLLPPIASFAWTGGELVSYQDSTNFQTTGVYVNGSNIGIGTTKTALVGLSVMNGNVGIGTWVTTEALNISTSVGHNIGVISSKTDGAFSGGEFVSTQDDNAATAANSRIFHFTAQGVSDSSHSTLAAAGFGAYTDQAFTASAAGTYWSIETTPDNSTTIKERMRIASSGNVGVGTTLSSSLLSVGGNLSVGTSYTNGTSAPTNGIAVLGNVGIGTTAPPQALYVVGTGVFTTGLNIGIGTAQKARACISANTGAIVAGGC